MKKLNKKKGNQSNFAKLSIFSPQKYKFKKKCPLSGKGAPIVDYKNIKLLKKYLTENRKIMSSYCFERRSRCYIRGAPG